MANYIVDEKIDFYNILNKFSKEQKEENKKQKEENKEEEEKKNICLISNEPLTKYFITLPCNHKFNYLPLLYSCYENSQLHYNYKKGKLKCPYCKQINYNQVLPYNPLLETTKYRHVNYPQTNVIGAKNQCSYVYKSGKNKGKTCDVSCYWDYCHKHLKCLEVTKTDNKTTQEKTNLYLASINLKTIGTDDLKKITVVNLRKLAKMNKKRNFSKLKKNDLILLLKSE